MNSPLNRLPFDPESIMTLATILRDTDLTEIELVEADTRIRLVRAPPVVLQAAPSAPPAIPAASLPLPSDDAPFPGTVTSPMVGIAYLAPEPGASPYIGIGQSVAAGQTVLLIEAMKTFNQIKAPHAGTVTRILVVSGQPVEYAQPLLVIE